MARKLLAIAAAGAIGAGALVWWWATRESPRSTRADVAAPSRPAPKPRPSKVTIRGTVYSQESREPIGGLTVVLAGPETASVVAHANGNFELVVPPGRYRAYVEDKNPSRGFISTGIARRPRVDSPPRRELVRAPDESLMPLIDASSDLDEVELSVGRAARIEGVVYDHRGDELAGVVVRARQDRLADHSLRPVLGTDLAITDASGSYRLLVPPGTYTLDASHPDYAGVAGEMVVTADAGQSEDVRLRLEQGCVITGRIEHANKSRGADGALERDDTQRVSGFRPVGHVEADGTFRWTTLDEGPITLRAWPWKSPASLAKSLPCRDGARHKDVVLTVDDWAPDLSGTIVDASGAPVPLAFLDVQSLDPGRSGQQERADAAGVWHVYDLLAGRYRITGTAPGRGIVDQVVVVPRHNLKLELAGTGRITGTTTDLVSGAIEVSLVACGPANDHIVLAPESRIVAVHGGRFTVDGVPACTLSFQTRWRDRVAKHTAVVEPGHTAYVEVEVGAPREKLVHGVVHDRDHRPVANARVTALVDLREAATVRTDDKGRYSLTTRSGAQLVAGNGSRVGRGTVGHANVAGEQVDLVLDDVGQ